MLQIINASSSHCNIVCIDLYMHAQVNLSVLKYVKIYQRNGTLKVCQFLINIWLDKLIKNCQRYFHNTIVLTVT